MNENLDFIRNCVIEDNTLKGTVSIRNIEPIAVSYNLERDEDVENIEDFSLLIAESKRLIEGLDAKEIERLFTEISTELTDSAYSQSEFQPAEAEYSELQDDLKICRIDFYQDGAMIVLKSEKCFKDMEIFCQINHDLEIEDLTVS